MIGASFLMDDGPDADDRCSCGHKRLQHTVEYYLMEIVSGPCHRCECKAFAEPKARPKAILLREVNRLLPSDDQLSEDDVRKIRAATGLGQLEAMRWLHDLAAVGFGGTDAKLALIALGPSV